MGLDFGLFIQDGKGPLWRESFTDLDTASRRAEDVARTESLECFVYNFKTYSEVVRFRPRSQKPREQREEWHLPSGPGAKK